MPEPVSMTLAANGYAALHWIARRGSTGLSDAAAQVQRSIKNVISAAERSISLFGMRDTAISSLWESALEHSQANWDGEGAKPVSLIAARNCETFLRALPDDLPMPEVAPQADGGISLDWIDSRSRIVSVGIGEGDRIPYAWIDGTERGHAVARFDPSRVSPRLLAVIRETISPADAAIRVA